MAQSILTDNALTQPFQFGLVFFTIWVRALWEEFNEWRD